MTTVALGGYGKPEPLPNRVVPRRATPRADRIERLRRPGRAERLCDRAGRESLPTRLSSSQIVVCARDHVESCIVNLIESELGRRERSTPCAPPNDEARPCNRFVANGELSAAPASQPVEEGATCCSLPGSTEGPVASCNSRLARSYSSFEQRLQQYASSNKRTDEPYALGH
jgi:hypothetical protein